MRHVPDEFQCVARQIAEGLGEVLSGDKQNSTLEDQRFCIALPAGEGWATSVEVVNDTIGEQTSIVLDYANLPIRCRYCMDTKHKAKDCPALASVHNKTPGAPFATNQPSTPPQQPAPPDKPPVVPATFNPPPSNPPYL